MLMNVNANAEIMDSSEASQLGVYEIEMFWAEAENMWEQVRTVAEVKDEVHDFEWQVKEQTWQVESTEVKETKIVTPTTYELLEWTETSIRIENIILNNPEKFVNIPWNWAKEKMKNIFDTIRNSATEFLKNRLWTWVEIERLIHNTIAPALEWNLLNLLTTQWRDKNEDMLNGIDKISFDNFFKLCEEVEGFWKANESYNKISQWMNAVDYLSVQEKRFSILSYVEHSNVLSSPLEFQKYLDNSKFSEKDFDAYENISINELFALFGIDQTKSFNFWISEGEKTTLIGKIWNIKVESVESVSLVWKLVWKAPDFLAKSSWLQVVANHLLDWVDGVNVITKMVLGVDLLSEFSKPQESRGLMYKVIDFVCKLIWITWWLDWIVKNRRLDRLNLWDKTENIRQIFKEYRDWVWEWENISIMDDSSCQSALSKFNLTDSSEPQTKWDYLRDAMVRGLDVSLLSPIVVKQTIWETNSEWKSYFKEEIFTKNWKQQKRLVVDESNISSRDKSLLVEWHINNMRTHLSEYEKNHLEDFYSHVHSIDDIAICMISSLYADKNDVIEWVKAQVFFPESYRMSDWVWTWNLEWGRENLDDSIDVSDKQKVSEQWVYDKAVEYGITDNRQIAYVLSTIKWESGFKNQKEIWWENKDYGKVDSETWKAYYGRWFIQITHKGNYEKYTQIIHNAWIDFKDNDWWAIKWSEVDLVSNPDIILQSNELAIFIAMDWMKNWWPYRTENKRLDYYINDNKQDYYNARIIINGMTSKPQEYADRAQEYLNTLGKSKIEKKDAISEFLIWPKLVAHNKNELGWLGNSIMTWFQWYYDKLNFPNMDGVESKNTQNHPNRFNSLLAVQSYKASHPDVKSFMFYFWANTQDNEKTLADIKQWSEWFQEEGIQPVLCTCIWEDKHEWLVDLNKSLIDLWKEKQRPVFDFAKSYNEWNIAMWSGSSPHPTSEGYSTIANIINSELSQS